MSAQGDTCEREWNDDITLNRLFFGLDRGAGREALAKSGVSA